MSDVLETFQQNADGLSHMEVEECVSVFQSDIVSDYASVILISNDSSSLQSGWASWSRDVHRNESLRWPCFGNSSDSGDCEPQSMDFTQPWMMQLPGAVSSATGTSHFVAIDHCLALLSPGKCTVNVSRTIMSVVIFTTVVKLSCFSWLLFMAMPEPLVTIGDVIASFLAKPDPNTVCQSYLSYKNVDGGSWEGQPKQRSPRWTDDKHFWLTVFDGPQYTVTMLL